MATVSNITKTEPLQRAERIEGSNEPVLPRVGQWYWMKTSEHVWFGEKPSELSDAGGSGTAWRTPAPASSRG